VIIGEVLRESFDDGSFRDTSLAANLTDDLESIVTRTELLALDGGPGALWMWANPNGRDGDLLETPPSGRPTLRLVTADEA
jgi:hypothetical protein